MLGCVCSLGAFSQNITGIWRGYFIGNAGEHYRLEFQVHRKSDGSIAVSGVSYSWQDDIRFYGKATMTGSFIDSSQNFRIREIKTVEVKNPGGGGTCIMNYDLRYSRSGKEEFLEGTYLGKPEVKGRENPYEWGDCGGGRVSLRRVTTTEFYEEPFLRKNTVTPKPGTTTPPTSNKAKITPKTNTNTTVKKPATTNKTTTNKTATTNKPKTEITKQHTAPKKDIIPPVVD